MATRNVYDSERHAQFVTFSCFRRRRMLDREPLRDALLDILAKKLADHSGTCCGYVVMPDHVHAILWFAQEGALGRFMKSWKQTSSIKLKGMLRGVAPEYAKQIPQQSPFWQARYYPVNLYSSMKAQATLDYIHENPVRADLVQHGTDWKWSSARYWLLGEPSTVPLKWIF